MVDKELRDNSAIKNVFPLSAVILSWFDVLQVSLSLFSIT